MGRYRFLAALIVAALAGGFLVLLPAIAANAEPSAVPPRPAGGGWVYAMPLALIPQTETYPSTGGWWNPSSGETNSQVGILGGGTDPVVVPGNTPTPLVRVATLRLSELYIAGTYLAVNFDATVLGDNRGSGYANLFFSGTMVNSVNGAYCSASSGWVQTSSVYKLNTSTNSGIGWTVEAATTGTFPNTTHPNQLVGIMPADTTTCPNIVKYQMSGTFTRQNNAQPLAGFQMQWSAEYAAGNAPSGYGCQLAGTCITDPLDYLCQSGVATASPDCVWHDPTGDGTNANVVCGNAPVLLWNDWSTMNSWVAFYAKCLFVPLNGFDRTGAIPAAWNASSAGQAITAVGGIAAELGIPETCGPIATGEVMGGMFNFDTCTWTWAVGLKPILDVGLRLLFGLWVVTYCVNTILGLFDKKTPTPLAASE